MSGPPADDRRTPAERALADIESQAASGEDHDARLNALDRLNQELETELEERDAEGRADH